MKSWIWQSWLRTWCWFKAVAISHLTSRGQPSPFFPCPPQHWLAAILEVSPPSRDTVRHRTRPQTQIIHGSSCRPQKAWHVPISLASAYCLCLRHRLLEQLHCPIFEVSRSAPPSDYWCSTRALLFAEPWKPDPTATRELQWRWADGRHVMWCSAEVSGAFFHS